MANSFEWENDTIKPPNSFSISRRLNTVHNNQANLVSFSDVYNLLGRHFKIFCAFEKEDSDFNVIILDLSRSKLCAILTI
jgi:hypothetical protein